METLLTRWRRIPALIRAVVCGFVVTTIGMMTFNILELINLQLSPQTRWAPFALIPALWLYWLYFAGHGPPKATSEIRHWDMKPDLPPRPAWGWVVIACLAVIIFTLNFQDVWQRVIGVHVPSDRFIEPGVPIWSQAATMLAIAVTAGVSEEVGIRGYLQSIVLRRHGPWIAIVASSLVFAFAHYNQAWGGAMTVFYIIAGGALGVLTYVSNSIVPAVVAHVSVNGYAFLSALFLGSKATDLPLADAGLDAAFWLNTGLVAIAATVLAIALPKIWRVAAAGGSSHGL